MHSFRRGLSVQLHDVLPCAERPARLRAVSDRRQCLSGGQKRIPGCGQTIPRLRRRQGFQHTGGGTLQPCHRCWPSGTQKPNSWTYSIFKSPHTWGFCKDFLNYLGKGGVVFYQVFFLFPLQCTVTHWRNCKRLREFEETKISRQSYWGDFSLDCGQEFGLCTHSWDYTLAYRIGIENNKRSKDVDERTELETQLISQMFRFKKVVQDLIWISKRFPKFVFR